MKIDVHNHAIPTAALELLREGGDAYGVRIEGDRMHGGMVPGFRLRPVFSSAERKLAELDANGLDAAVLSVAPMIFFYEVDPGAGEAMAREANRGLAELGAAGEGRLSWMATVPMQAPERAVAVLEEAAAAGCAGVEVATTVCGRPLDAEDYEPFWAAAERLGLPVMLHPAYNAPVPALDSFYLKNVVGHLFETTVAAERLVCAGTLDRHPGLRVVLVHGGGYFAFQAGRLRHARTVRPELASAPEDPWAYAGRLVFDVITHDREALAYLVARVGVENVVMGTDLPFDMAPPQPVAMVEEAVGAEAARTISEDNPARLYGLPRGSGNGSP